MTILETRPATSNAWMRCPGCGDMIYRKRYDRADRVCPECDSHGPLTADERIALLLDADSAEQIVTAPTIPDPLRFTDTRDYPARLADARRRTGMSDAARCVRGRMGGVPVVLVVLDFRFFGGSLGAAVGEAVTTAAETALADRAPLVIVSASGGARMQEGILALMQMAKTSHALQRLDEAGVLTVSVVTDPTYGGVAASFATSTDIIIAEPGARLGFAGPRVIAQTIGETLPEGFQTAEFLLAHGCIDLICHRNTLRDRLTRLVATTVREAAEDIAAQSNMSTTMGFCESSVNVSPDTSAQPGSSAEMPGEPRATIAVGMQAEPGSEVAAGFHDDVVVQPDSSGARDMVEQFGRLGEMPEDESADASRQPDPLVVTDPDSVAERDPWECVRAARELGRPTTLDYLAGAFDEFIELHGDRLAADCPALIAGLARLDGKPVVAIGTQKGHTAAELTRHNYGMPTPAGYRKAARLARLAAKLELPVVTLIDTAGAYPGVAAEENGQAVAIAESLKLFAGLDVPVVAVITGEGGSGGALALGVADRVLVCENAVYSVISPEGCASILWKDAAAAPRAARALRVDSGSLLRLGVADAVLLEPPGGAHRDPVAMIGRVRTAVTRMLSTLRALSPDELSEARYQRFRAFGRVSADGPDATTTTPDA
ncbi:acetyl-CoA carboxylase, carboxyltransferase subunit beta [Nocardia macrotermitis]|uniref:Multifunctional fusion protein n=1 Tax=Nocardia macrotermitis TaxID=2585198 RepID=A0A7K0CUT4_9NOCA|nr:acetyl-CoA carboxylase, carboxyltransferase subunit beta [Nocardia macrotermitis]MQY17153.1 Acetyl-coenzyme A carboxylase carboxyl transferase subunit alpha [Nocardia macrotermitis]